MLFQSQWSQITDRTVTKAGRFSDSGKTFAFLKTDVFQHNSMADFQSEINPFLSNRQHLTAAGYAGRVRPGSFYNCSGAVATFIRKKNVKDMKSPAGWSLMIFDGTGNSENSGRRQMLNRAASPISDGSGSVCCFHSFSIPVFFAVHDGDKKRRSP